MKSCSPPTPRACNTGLLPWAHTCPARPRLLGASGPTAPPHVAACPQPLPSCTVPTTHCSKLTRTGLAPALKSPVPETETKSHKRQSTWDPLIHPSFPQGGWPSRPFGGSWAPSPTPSPSCTERVTIAHPGGRAGTSSGATARGRCHLPEAHSQPRSCLLKSLLSLACTCCVQLQPCSV